MSPGLRGLLATVIVVGSFAAAAALSIAQRRVLLEGARDAARASVDASWTQLARDVSRLPSELETRATALAKKEGLRRLIQETAGGSDDAELRATIADLNSMEPWFNRATKSEWVGLVVGDRLVFASDDAAERLSLVSLLEHVTETEGQLVELDRRPWLLGAARIADNKRAETAVLVLARPMTTDDLKPLANGVALEVSAGDPARAVSAGASEDLERLSRWRTAMKLGDAPCCVATPLKRNLTLAVSKDLRPLLEKAEADAAHAQWPRFAAAAAFSVLASLALLLVGRRRRDEATDQLLRDTQAQLRQSQEVLQKLSTGAFATHAAANQPVPVSALSEALASTQASAAPSRYEVVTPLGEGGMAKVSLAVVRGAEGFKRTFVLKRLKPEHQANPQLVNQFIDEARLGASLVHSNIVPIFDFGRDADGYYLAQEYILGRSVEALVQASMAQRGRGLEVPVVVTIAQETLKALAYAHTRANDAGQPLGLVHRDVSPSNLMVSQRGEVKLLDFGIVKSNDRVTQTQAGTVKGNLFYMSPEQGRALSVDARSDLFSLGMVMVTALLGTPLYGGNTMYELMTRAAAGPTSEDLQRVRAGTGELAAFLWRALSIDPGARFASASEMAAALSQAAAGASAAELEQLVGALLGSALAEEQRRFQEAS